MLRVVWLSGVSSGPDERWFAMKAKRLFQTIVGYGFALTTTVGGGTACSGPPRAIREGVTPHLCELEQCSVAGRVLDTDGNPLAGVRVGFRGLEVTTDASGRYALDLGHYNGSPELVIELVTADGRSLRHHVEYHNGGAKTVDIQFREPARSSRANADAGVGESDDGGQ